MIDTVKYFNDETPSKAICSIRTSCMSHLMCFAAEEARANRSVVDMQQYFEDL